MENKQEFEFSEQFKKEYREFQAQLTSRIRKLADCIHTHPEKTRRWAENLLPYFEGEETTEKYHLMVLNHISRHGLECFGLLALRMAKKCLRDTGCPEELRSSVLDVIHLFGISIDLLDANEIIKNVAAIGKLGYCLIPILKRLEELKKLIEQDEED